MIKVIQKPNELRKDYLIRVAIEVLKENSGLIPYFEFDEAECDANCLADDLKIEFQS